MSTVLTTTDRYRPGSLRNSVRRLFARASNGRGDSRSGMFDRAQNTSIQNANFTINQYGALTVDQPLPVAVTVAGGRIAAGNVAASSRAQESDTSPRPRRPSPDVYVDCLLTKNCGYPLWIPSPNRTLPVFNRTLGVSVGDVGVLTPEGGFDFLFNIFHDATHPINAVVGVPDQFTPFSPAPAPADIQQSIEWNAGTFLADASIVKVPNDENQSSITLEATSTEGVVLMIPEDIYTTKLKITTRLRKYVEENIVGWYRFVKHTLGHDIENGDLRVVYGCRKSSGFGVATAFNTGRPENTKLSFSVEGSWSDISRCPYKWSHTGSAEVKTGPSGADNVECSLTEPVKNQCLFVNTIDAKISDETWNTVELSTVVQVMPGLSGEPNSGKHAPTAKSSEPGSTAGSSSNPCYERAFHPSAVLQDILETITPGLLAYIVCDEDWAPFVLDTMQNSRDLVEQILQERIIAEEQGMTFFCAENDVDLSEELGRIHAAHIRCRRIGPIEGSPNESCSHWQAERRVNMSTGGPGPIVRDFGLETEKTDISQNRDANSLSDFSKFTTSSVPLPSAEIASTASTGLTRMRNIQEKSNAHDRRRVITGTTLSGTAVVLGLVNEAAQFSNIPSLRNAASLALGIVTIIQALKKSNHQYGLLAKDATDIVATIWRSYQQSTNKEDWLSPDLQGVITELVVTLTDITEFVKAKTKPRKFVKIFSRHADPTQMLEYSERLKSAMKKFELISHIKSDEMKQQVHRDQLQPQHLSHLGIESLPTAAVLLHALGDSPSGFDTETSANTSLVTLPSSVAPSQHSITATWMRAGNQPSGFLTEGSTQSPCMVLTGAASNSSQSSSPPVAPSFPSQSQLPPSSLPISSSLPSSPPFNESSISTPPSASAGSSAHASPTLVGSPNIDNMISSSAATIHRPSPNFKKDNLNDQHTNDHEDYGNDINISVDAPHVPPADPTPDYVGMGRRMRTAQGNAILKGFITASPSASPSGTATESVDSRGGGGRSSTWSDTSTAVSDWGMTSASTRALEKERQYFIDQDSIDNDDDNEGQYEEQLSQWRWARRRPARMNAESTLTSKRKEVLKPSALRHEQKQTTVYEEDEDEEDEEYEQDVEYEEDEEYQSPEPFRRPRKETEDYFEHWQRPKPAKEQYGGALTLSQPSRGPVRRTSPKGSIMERQRIWETYADSEEEEHRHTSGKAKAPRRNYRPAQDASDEEEVDQGEFSETEYDSDDEEEIGTYFGARGMAAVAARNSARKAVTTKDGIGKDEQPSVKFGGLDIDGLEVCDD